MNDETGYCTSCRGEGVIHTGIDESPIIQCSRCDGTGELPSVARVVAEPAGELPPLPDPVYLGGDEAFGDVVRGYTKGCMEDYARAALAARQAPTEVTSGMIVPELWQAKRHLAGIKKVIADSDQSIHLSLLLDDDIEQLENFLSTRVAPDVAVARDAARYQWLRKQQWNASNLFVVAGSKSQVSLGTDCPSVDRLDDAIDAAITQEKTK